MGVTKAGDHMWVAVQVGPVVTRRNSWFCLGSDSKFIEGIPKSSHSVDWNKAQASLQLMEILLPHLPEC